MKKFFSYSKFKKVGNKMKSAMKKFFSYFKFKKVDNGMASVKYEYDVVCVVRELCHLSDDERKLTRILRDEVQRRLNEGWMLQGGVTISQANYCMMAAQAIVRKK